jgi:hypothetical protein
MTAGYPQAPSFQVLVEKSGGYHNITPEAWREHDAAMVKWHHERRIDTCGIVYEGRKPKAKSKKRNCRRTTGNQKQEIWK